MKGTSRGAFGQVQRQRANVCLLPELRQKALEGAPQQKKSRFRLLLAAGREGHCAGGWRAGAGDGLVAWDDPASAGRDVFWSGSALLHSAFVMSGSCGPAPPHRTPPALLCFPL